MYRAKAVARAGVTPLLEHLFYFIQRMSYGDSTVQL